uniref:Uncharacterized protein n=1 Tax=Kwoniella bestiolae CBS 10118 TaxID=1296100 RepID=A0A1B9GBI7_9TREE|nr:hypothetical protein I302_03247 [Kwoniella bestiolae CBS 10118]OCF28388.1 hypothetical protein I302_03247 [Kwoniella bestiolae CBS 10118]
MFAPPGVDSSSSGEELTPPPSPVTQKIRPKFSFRSLFSPAKPSGSDSHRRARSRSFLRNDRNRPTNEEVKHSTPVEAAEADPAFDTDNSLTPKKRVRIYAGELQSGQKARGLTNNLGEGVRDSLTLPTARNHEPMIDTDGNGAGISEEVFMMLKRYTDEQKELEHAEREHEHQREEASPPSPPDTGTPQNEISSSRPPTPIRRPRPKAKAKPKTIITDTTLDDYAEPPTSPSPVRKERSEQSKPSDILLRLKSSASSLSKKRSLKSLRSIKLNKKSLASHDVPPVPPIPKGNDGEAIMISRTPIADRFARPRSLLPQTAPPGMNEFSQTTAQSQGAAQHYYHPHPESPAQCPHCHSPHTAPPMPFYPVPTSEAQRWCQPPGWPIHPYYPVSPPLYPQTQNISIPVSYVPAHHPQAITPIDPPPTVKNCHNERPSPSKSREVRSRDTQPVLRSGPMREVRKHKAETCDSVEREIRRSSQIESVSESRRSTKDETQNWKQEVSVDPTVGGSEKSKDDQEPIKEEIKDPSPSPKDGAVKPSEKGEEDAVVPSPTVEPDSTDMAKEEARERLKLLVKQYKAKYAEAIKVYKSPGLSEGERENAKERVKRTEGKLREATQALKEYEISTEPSKGESKDDSAMNDQRNEKNVLSKDKKAREEETDAAVFKRENGLVDEQATEEVTQENSVPPSSSMNPVPDDRQEKAHLDATINKFQSRLAQYKRAYTKEGISSEQKNDLKERIKVNQAKLDEALRELRKLEMSAGQTDELEEDQAKENENEERPIRKSDSPAQQISALEEERKGRPDEQPGIQDASEETQRIKELQEAVEKCQIRYKHAMKMYKAEGLSEEKRKAARDEVKKAEGRLKESIQVLDQARKDIKGNSRTAGTGDTTAQTAKLNVDKQNAEVGRELSKVEHGKDTRGQGLGDGAGKQRKVCEIPSSPSQRTEHDEVEGGGTSQQEDIELLVNKYQLRHKDAVKIYESEGLTEEQKEKAREEVRRAEGKLKEAMQALKAVQNQSKEPVDGKSDTGEALWRNDGAGLTDDVNMSNYPEIKDVSKAEDQTQKGSDPRHKKQNEREELVNKYQIRHREVVKAYRQPNLPEEKKAKLREEIKRAEGKLKEAVQSLEALRKEKKGELNERAGKVDGEEEKESTKKDIEEQKQESATGQAGDNGIKELKEIVEKYRLRYQEAVKVYKQDDLSDDKKEEARLSVKRAEAKLKEAVQALESTMVKSPVKVEENAVSDENKGEGLMEQNRHKETENIESAGMSFNDTSTQNADVRSKKLEETIERYQAQHKQALKVYKQDDLPDEKRREAKESLKVVEGKLKEATEALASLQSQGQTEQAGEGPIDRPEGKTSEGHKHHTEGHVEVRSGEASADAHDQKLGEMEKTVQKYQARHRDAVKRYKSEGLSDQQRKEVKELIQVTQVKLREAMKALEDI